MTQPAGRTINIGEVLENSPIGPLQIRVFALCMICLIMDGFDVQAMGYVGPAIVARLGDRPLAARARCSPPPTSACCSARCCFSMLADKIGRRPVLVGATLFFSVMTIATAYAQNIEQLLWLRFIAGIGMGCIIPNATALVGEFSPKRTPRHADDVHHRRLHRRRGARRIRRAWLIPAFGWRSVFIFGGAIPLVIACAMAWGLPESLQFLAVRRTQLDQLARWLQQLDPALAIDARDAVRRQRGEPRRRARSCTCSATAAARSRSCCGSSTSRTS